MYRVYWNQAAAAYLFLYLFIFLALQFSNIKSFRHTFLRNCEALKVETWYTHGRWQIYRVYQNQAAALIHPFSSSVFFLSNFQTLKLQFRCFESDYKSKNFENVRVTLDLPYLSIIL